MLGEEGEGSVGGSELPGGDDGGDPRTGGGASSVDGSKAGVRVGRTDDRHVEAVGDSQVVEELAGAGDEARILAAADDAPGVLSHELPL